MYLLELQKDQCMLYNNLIIQPLKPYGPAVGQYLSYASSTHEQRAASSAAFSVASTKLCVLKVR
jgi:hypothetical protein